MLMVDSLKQCRCSVSFIHDTFSKTIMIWFIVHELVVSFTPKFLFMAHVMWCQCRSKHVVHIQLKIEKKNRPKDPSTCSIFFECACSLLTFMITCNLIWLSLNLLPPLQEKCCELIDFAAAELRDVKSGYHESMTCPVIAALATADRRKSDPGMLV